MKRTYALALSLLIVGCSQQSQEVRDFQGRAYVALRVNGMSVTPDGVTCAGCMRMLQEDLEALPGVETAEFSVSMNLLRIKFNKGAVIDRAALLTTVHARGYEVEILSTVPGFYSDANHLHPGGSTIPQKMQPSLKKAQSAGKLLLVSSYPDWCKRCEERTRAILGDIEVKKLIEERFILVQAGLSDNEWAPWDSSLALPDFCVVSATGTIVDRILGFPGVVTFLAHLRKCAEHVRVGE